MQPCRLVSLLPFGIFLGAVDIQRQREMMATQVGFDTNYSRMRNGQKDLQNTIQHLAEILRRNSNLTHKRIKVQTRGELLILKVCLMIRNPLNSKLLYIEFMELLLRLRVQDNTYVTNGCNGILVVETQLAHDALRNAKQYL